MGRTCYNDDDMRGHGTLIKEGSLFSSDKVLHGNWSPEITIKEWNEKGNKTPWKAKGKFEPGDSEEYIGKKLKELGVSPEIMDALDCADCIGIVLEPFQN